jgi:hypothetical protein
MVSSRAFKMGFTYMHCSKLGVSWCNDKIQRHDVFCSIPTHLTFRGRRIDGNACIEIGLHVRLRLRSVRKVSSNFMNSSYLCVEQCATEDVDTDLNCWDQVYAHIACQYGEG